MRISRYAKGFKRFAALSAAVAAALSQSAHTALADSVYTGGGAGTASNPVSGTFSTGFTPAVTAGAATLALDFSDGTSEYTATDDLAGALSLNLIQFNLAQGGTAPATLVNSDGSLTTGRSLNFVVNGTTNPLINQFNTGPVNLNLPISVAAAANPLTFGGAQNIAGVGTPNGTVGVGGAVSGLGGLVFGGSNTVGALATSVGLNGGYNAITLTGANTYAGATLLDAGTLTLDFTTDNTNKISAGALTLGGGSLVVTGNAGAATSQTVSGTTLNGGVSVVVNPGAGQAATLNLGAITRVIGGAADFGTTGTINTNTPNPTFTGGSNTILGGYATVGGGGTFATSAGTAGTPGPITGLATGSYSTTFAAAADVDAPAATNAPGALTINSLRINNTGAATAVNNTGTLTVASGGILVTPNVGNFAAAIGAAGATQAITSGNGADLVVNQYNTANTLTINDVISGSVGLTKSGPGTLILGNTLNTFTGDVYVDGGTLQFAGSNGTGNSGPIGSTGAATFKRVVLTNNATVSPGGFNDNTPTATASASGEVFFIGAGGGQINLTAGQTLILDDGSGAGTASTAAELQGFGDLTVKGGGILSVGNGTSNFGVFTGQIIIATGTTLQTGSGSGNLGSNTAGTIVQPGGVLNFNGNSTVGAEPLTVSGTGISSGGALINGTGSSTFTGTVNLAASSSVGGAGNLTLGGVVSGAGSSLTKVGAGILTLSGVNTYTGGTVVSAGTIVTSNASALGAGAVSLNAGTLTVAAGTTLTTGTITLNGGSTLTSGAGSAGTITNAVATGTGGTIAPGGVFNFSTSVGVGTLNVGSLSASNSSTLNFDLTTPTTASDTINVTTLNGFTVAGNVPVTLGELPSQPGTYRLVGFTSSTTPTFTGANFVGPAGSGRLTFAYSVDNTSGNQYFVDLTVSGLGGGRTYVFTNNTTPAGDNFTTPGNYNPPNDGTAPGVAGDSVTFNNGSNVTYTINLNSTPRLGTVNFSNSGTGSYVIAAGTGGTLTFDSGGASAAALNNNTNSNSITAPVVLASATNVTVTGAANTLTLGGVVSGSGTLTLTAANAGTVLLSGANTYTSPVVLNGGILKAGSAAFLGASTGVTVNGGTIDLNNFATGQPFFLNGVGAGGAGVITNSSAAGGNPTVSSAITLQSNATVGVPNNYVLSGVVSGAFTLTKTGAGQLSLVNAANTFSGGLNINAGAVATNAGDLSLGAANTPVNLNGNNVSVIVNQASQFNDTHPFNFTAGNNGILSVVQNQKLFLGNANSLVGPSTATFTRTAQSGATTGNIFQVSGNNAGFSGAVVLTGGVVEVQNPFGLGNAAATNTVTLANAFAAATNTTNELASPNFPQNITINNPNGGVSSIGADGGNSVYTGSITANGPFNVQLGNFFNTSAFSVSFNGPLSGSGAITFTPPTGGALSGQVLTLAGNNSSYTASNTVPTNVAVAAASPTALGTGTWTVNATGAIDIQSALTSGTITVTGGAGIAANPGVLRNTAATSGSYGGAETLAAATTLGVTGAGNLTLSGNVTGNQALTVVGGTANTGALILSGQNAFSSIAVPSGTLEPTAPGAVSGATLPTITVGNTAGTSNAAVLLGGATGNTYLNNIVVQAGSTGIVTLGGVNPAGTTNTYGATLTFNRSVVLDATNAGAITAFSNPITGAAVGVTKGPGAGIVQVNNTTYGGATVVNGGQLQFAGTNTGAGAITVNNGGTLSNLTGDATSLAGNITVNTGGTIAPGGFGNATATTLTLNGSLTLNNTSAVNFDFAGNGGPVDRINLASGSLTIAGNPLFQIVTGPNSSAPGNYRLITDGGTVPANLGNAVVTGAPAGTSYTLSGSVDPGFIDLVVGGSATFTYNPGGAAPAGGGATGSFNSAGNFTPNGVPGTGSTALFPNLTSAGTHTVTLDAPQRVAQLTLDPGTGNVYAFTVGAAGGALSVESGITNNSGVNTFAAPLTLVGATTVAVPTTTDPASSLTVTAAGSFAQGGNPLTKTGGGLFNVAAIATGTGGGTVSGGTLQFSNVLAATPNVLSGTYAVAPGATLRAGAVGGSAVTTVNALGTSAVTLNAGGSLVLNPQDTTAATGLFYRKFASLGNTSGANFTQAAASTGTITALNGTNQFASAATETEDFTGKLNVTTAGSYTFGLNADDGARLFIDGQLATNNDTGAGKGQGTLITGQPVSLSSGFHDIRVQFTNSSGSGGLLVTYTGQGLGGATGAQTNATLPFAALFQPAVTNTTAYVPLPNAIQMTNNVVVAAGASASTIDVGSTNAAAQNFVGVQIASLTLNGGSTLNVTGAAANTGTTPLNTLNPTTNLDAGRFLASTATSVVGGGTVNLNTTADYYAGGLTDNGTPVTIVKSGTGQLVLDPSLGANTLSSGTQIQVNAGRLHLYGGASNPLGSAIVVLNGATADVVLDTRNGAPTFDNGLSVLQSGRIEDFNDAITTTVGGVNGVSLASGATLTLDATAGSPQGAPAGATLALAGPVSGSGALNVVSTTYANSGTQPGTVLVSNPNNSFTGGVTISSGSLQANGAPTATPGVLGTGTITLLTPTTGEPTELFLKSNGAGINGAVTFGGGNPVAITGAGATTIDVNNLTANTGNTITLGTLSMSSGTTLNVTGANSYALAFNGAATLGGAVTFSPSTANLLLAGQITSSAGITKTGAGILTLGADGNSYTTTTVTAGTLRVGNGGATGSLGSGAVTDTASVVAFNFTGAKTFSNVITGTGAVTQIGAGTSILTGNSNYTGTTTVSAGILAINTAAGGGTTGQGTYTIASGATLEGGTTTVASNIGLATGSRIVASSGGTFHPGNSPGQINVNGVAGAAGSETFTLQSGSNYAVDVNGPTKQTQYGSTAVVGNVNVTGANLAVNLGYTPAAGDVYYILTNDSTDAVVGTFATVNGATLTDNGNGTFSAITGGTTYTLSYTSSFDTLNPAPGSGNDIALTAAVPEPASLGLFGLAGLGLLATRRRRRA